MKENKIKKTTFQHTDAHRGVYYIIYMLLFVFLNVGCRSNIQQKKAWKRIREKAQKKLL